MRAGTDREEERDRFVSHSLRTYAVQLLVTGMNVVMTVLTVRFLGPEGKGMLSLLILIPVLTVVLGRSGIGNSLIFHASRVRRTRLIFHGLALTLVIGTGVSLFSAAVVFWQRKAVFNGIPSIGLAVMCIMSIFYFLYDLAPFLFLAFQRIDLRNLLTLLFPSANIMFFVLFVVVLRGAVKGAVVAWSLAVLVPVLVSLAWINKHDIWCERNLDRPLTARLLNFGLKSHVGTIMEMLNYRADFFVVSFFAGPAAVGLYACAVNMAESVWKLPEALTVVLMPKVASLSPAEARSLTAKVGRVVMLLVTVLFLVIIVLRRPIILFLFGRAFLPSARPFLILVPGFIAFSFWKIFAYGLMAQGYPQKYSLTSILAFLIMIAADFLLVPRMGISGAALASTAAYLLATGAMIFIYRNTTGTSLRDMLIPYKSDWAGLAGALRAGSRERAGVTPDGRTRT